MKNKQKFRKKVAIIIRIVELCAIFAIFIFAPKTWGWGCMAGALIAILANEFTGFCLKE